MLCLAQPGGSRPALPQGHITLSPSSHHIVKGCQAGRIGAKGCHEGIEDRSSS